MIDGGSQFILILHFAWQSEGIGMSIFMLVWLMMFFLHLKVFY